jgi:hypothetical protein
VFEGLCIHISSDMSLEESSTMPEENDVLLGRGGATNNHYGNCAYRSIVAGYRTEYLAARKKDKVVIARKIVELVHRNGGRFLARDDVSDAWTEAPDKRAVSKTSQTLREGLDVRNNVIRTKKSVRHSSDFVGSDEGSRKRAKISSGKLSPAIVSLSGENARDMPDLHEEVETMLRYQPSPIDRSHMKNVCEI